TGGDRHGAFATYVVAPSRELVAVVEERVALRTAALTEPLAVALHALTQAHAEPGHRALVTGAGPIGLLALAALHARGIDDVTVCEPSPLRRERAEAIGASATVTPDALAVPAMPNDVAEEVYDVVLECSGR